MLHTRRDIDIYLTFQRVEKIFVATEIFVYSTRLTNIIYVYIYLFMYQYFFLFFSFFPLLSILLEMSKE